MGKTIWDLVNEDNTLNKNSQMLTNSTKAITDFYRTLTPNVINGFNSDIMNSVIPDVIKTMSPNTVEPFRSNMFQSIIPDTLKALTPNVINGFNSDIMNSVIPDVIKTMFPNTVEPFRSNMFRNIIPDTFKALTPDVIKGFNSGIINSITPAALKTINTSISQTVNELSEKTEFDDSDYETVNDLSNYALEITNSKKLPTIVRKNILLNILQKLWKLIGIPQFAILVTVILFCLQTFDVLPQKNQKHIIKETIREIIIIEKEYKKLNLRGIIYNGVKVYKKPNKRSISTFSLDCGDIVEIMKINKKWVYVRIYETDIEGWVLKKYTKGNKDKKNY